MQNFRSFFRAHAPLLAAAGCLFLLTMLGTNAALAYFTDRAEAHNAFVYGQVDVIPFEPQWVEPDEPGLPNQSYPKDPKVGNTGNSDAILFAKVSVPVEKFSTASTDTGQQATKDQVQDVFWLKTEKTPLDEEANHFHTDPDGHWVLLSQTPGEEGGVSTYLFGYGKILPPSTNTETATAGRSAASLDTLDSKTDPLFDVVQYKNFIEGTLEGDFTVQVDAYAIQARYLTDDAGHDLTEKCYTGDTLDDSVTLTKDELTTIWGLYGTQTHLAND